ncbi:hypothetical protein BHM03_00056379, partial [Ensete ventricosum]
MTNAYCMSDNLTKKSLESFSTYPKIELERGDAPSSIQCYMLESGVPETVARKKIKELIKANWRGINGDRSSSFGEIFKTVAVGLPRISKNIGSTEVEALGLPTNVHDLKVYKLGQGVALGTSCREARLESPLRHGSGSSVSKRSRAGAYGVPKTLLRASQGYSALMPKLRMTTRETVRRGQSGLRAVCAGRLPGSTHPILKSMQGRGRGKQ